MNMKDLRTGVAAAMGGAILVGGLLVGASIALAQGDEQPSVSGDTPTTTTEATGDHSHAPCDFFGRLADQLGISLDELQQRLDDGASVDQLLEEAGLDPSSMLEEMRQNDFRRVPGDVGSRFPFGRAGGWLEDLNLDIDLGELRDRLESGMTLEEALTDLGVDVDSLVEQARQSALDRIDQLLSDGVITQDRANELKQMVENFDAADGFPFGFDFHFGDMDGMGPGGHHGNGFDFFGRSHDDSTDAPSSEGVSLNV